MVRDCTSFTSSRVLHKRPLVKDPIAIFSAEWLASAFNMDVVVLIRHPAAFAGSLKKAKWTHPFRDFSEQPLLMTQHLSNYKEEINRYARNETDVINQAILLWNLIHYMIIKYQKNHNDWIFVRHEDLSEDPKIAFKNIYDKLNIAYSSDIERKLLKFSFSEDAEGLKRDSKSNILSWKDRLTEDEIKRIKNGTSELANTFYPDEYW